MMVMIDNYDSFTYNIVQMLMGMGQEVRVFRNDELSLPQLVGLRPERIVVSPGPGNPNEAGISLEAIQYFAGRIPTFGVCLGHQTIAQAYGAKIVRAQKIMHGKTSAVMHDGIGLFSGVSQNIECTRYHSLLVERDSIPDDFEISAWTADQEIMGLRHTPTGAEGLQFHPESILSEEGDKILRNMLR